VTGKVKCYDVEADSGHSVSHEFCPVCGSPVFSATTQFPYLISIYAASLDDPTIFNPERVVFSASAQPWDYVHPSLAN